MRELSPPVWHHHWGQRLSLKASHSYQQQLFAHHADGTLSRYTRSTTTTATSTTNTWVSADQGKDVLSEVRDAAGVLTGYQLRRFETDAVETYNTQGVLLSVRERNGWTATLQYSDTSTPASLAPRPGLLLAVRNHFGRELRFTYNSAAQLTSATGFDGQTVRYSYDSTGRLTRVTWPDAAFRTYHYEDSRFTYALTGITDELGVRLTTYAYDSEGRAVLTSLAAGVQATQVAYNPTTQTSTITDALGTSYQIQYQTQGGVIRPIHQTQAAGSGCAASARSTQYDSQGNVTSRTDFNGVKTVYGYDTSRALETARIEGLTSDSGVVASATALPEGARKISSRWHPQWQLLTQRAEPLKRTTWVYHGQPDPTAGNAIANCAPADAVLPDGSPIAVLCKHLEQATTDTNGSQGFSAPLQSGVAARTTTYTYNAQGQVLTENGPRTDVNDLTSYEYYTDTQAQWTAGDLKSITNALGHTTRYLQYDRNGRVLQIQHPDGQTTHLQYHPRGWVSQIEQRPAGSSSGLITGYDYHPSGQLSRVHAPDGSHHSYQYDAAQRLIGITDALGNQVHYTLDALGNRTQEQWKDPAGQLRRQIQRSYDALGRVQRLQLGSQP